jgi:Endonuclease-reverse transcriptase
LLKPNNNVTLKGYEGFFDSVNAEKAQHGTVIFVKNGTKVEDIFIHTELNAVAVRVNLETVTSIVSVYIPPSEVSIKNKAANTITKLKQLVRQLPTPYIITGDFNAHCITWGCNRTNVFGKKNVRIH